MPWYQPGDPRGYSKFYDEPGGQGDPDREDRFEVSEAFLGTLLVEYSKAYWANGGVDIEDTDSILLDRFAARGITTADEAIAYGIEQAALDREAGEDVHLSALPSLPGGTIPVTSLLQDQVQTANRQAAGMITGSGSMPVGQPAFGGVAAPAPQLSGGTPSSPPIAGAGVDLGLLIMLGLIGVGAWLLFSGK